MAHSTHKLEIFRGLLKFKSNEQKIWGVFIFLSLVTIVEVALGIIKPIFLLVPLFDAFPTNSLVNEFLNFIMYFFSGTKILNTIFIVLTLVKAYYITWDFMHMRDEEKWFRRSIVWIGIFLAVYLLFILLKESSYIHNIIADSFMTWDF